MPAGVYIHIPFCKSRCSYCDFATDIYRNADWADRYVDAVCKEIAGFKPPEGGTRGADTIYFGGGTPSLLTPEQLAKIVNEIDLKFEMANIREITMEMNPATVTPQTLAGYRSLGVNRASFGVQTFNDRALKLLARGHTAADASRTFEMLRKAGFENISFDLIAGLPGQTLDDWRANLDRAVALSPEHISLYLLEIHEGTPMAEQIRRGRQPTPDDDLAAEMYEIMLDRLSAAGYDQYEISNFARHGYHSRHNTKYWMMYEVFGFGVSAHSFNGRERYSNTRDTAIYINLVESTGAAEIKRDDIDVASEYAFLRLRMEQGIDLAEYQRRFGTELLRRYDDDLRDLLASALIVLSEGSLKLTRKGKLFSNEVFQIFV